MKYGTYQQKKMMINNGGVNLHCQIFLMLVGHSFKNLRITSAQNSKISSFANQ